MKFCLVTNSVSPHQMPLAESLVERLGSDCFRYISTGGLTEERRKLGWSDQKLPDWVLQSGMSPLQAREAAEWISGADVLLCGNRDFDLFEKRAAAKKITFYMSERWLKPPWGIMRLLHPLFLRMALKMGRFLHSPYFYYLPIGSFAVKDMRRIASLPGFNLQSIPFKLYLWGYYVGLSGQHPIVNMESGSRLKILWFGRFLKWKRTDLLIQAVRKLDLALQKRLSVKIMGMGPQEGDLRRRIARYQLTDCIEISPPKPIEAVRQEIREADICVVTSNAQEGWGVAVNEIMIEGRCIVASDGIGAGATMVSHRENGLLFKDGSSRDLAAKLKLVIRDEKVRHELAEKGRKTVLAEWLPETAADRILEFSEVLLAERQFNAPKSGPLSVV